jgi:site-specific DNA recombinase
MPCFSLTFEQEYRRSKDRFSFTRVGERSPVGRKRFSEIGSATKLARSLAAAATTTRSGKPMDKVFLYRMLNNRTYVCDAVHNGTAYPGEHEPIISCALWDRVHAILQVSPRSQAAGARAQTPARLKGLLFGPTGGAMSPTHTRRRNKLYRYYVTARLS